MIAPLLLLPLIAPPQEVVLDRVLAVESMGRRRRSPVPTDALEAGLARGTWKPPVAGQVVRSAGGRERTWTPFEADESGWLRGAPFRGGWAYGSIDVPESGCWRLTLNGPSFALVEGAPRAGDFYRLGITHVPLFLEAGELPLLLRGSRGSMRVSLEPAPARVYFESSDTTLPDAVLEEADGTRLLSCAVIVSNATEGWLNGWRVRTSAAGQAPTDGYLPAIAPESSRKVGLRVAVFTAPEGDSLPVTLELSDPEGEVVHTMEITLRVRSANERHRRTFVSEIDRSIQYYAVTPPAEPSPSPGLLLTLHGASIEAEGHAGAYAPHDDIVIVAPTGRRPYGFDWEDQGRVDALEVLAHARALYRTDPVRTWLSGHSMGGHGTWQLGVHFPGRFAVVAPSAGWRDFWSYGGAGTFPEDDAVGRLLARAANPSRTLLLEENLGHAGVYVLHGDADEQVSVEHARFMRGRIGAFHPDFAYHERPGAGHWWGSECVDWPPLFEFLGERQLPASHEVLEVDFRTISPAVNDRCHWVRVLGQERWLEPSRARVRLVPEERRLELETENVTRLHLDLRPFTVAEEDAVAGEDASPVLAPGAPLELVSGEHQSSLEWPESGRLHLGRDPEGRFGATDAPTAWIKGAHRAGPFKNVFDRGMIFVYGTAGTPEEQAWSLAKARYDHEVWRYRGNGQVDIVSDTEFLGWPVRERNVILYGNQDTNVAFPAVLGDVNAFTLRSGHVSVGEDYAAEGGDLALLLCYPRKDTERALVGVVGGTGIAGMRLTNDLPYFVSGVAYPDWTVIGVDMLEKGLEGVRAAGFFRDDWSPLAQADTAVR